MGSVRYRRGARVIRCGPLRRGVWRLRSLRHGCVTLGGKPLSAQEETRHFKLIGTTGAGKSTAIRELLTGALRRGDRAVIADPDGGYRTRFFDAWRGDVVLNPFDGQSLRWNPFSELQEPGDCENLAQALISTSEDASSNEWRGYARTFLAAVLAHGQRAGFRDTRPLWRLLSVAGAPELRPVVAGTPAQPFLTPDNARMFGSIRAVAVAALRALDHVHEQRGLPFSVRDWVRGGSGVLFLPYAARQIAALRTLIASWIGLAIFEALSQEEGRDQRLWLVVDELDALGAIDGLKDALARLRKFGGRCVLGFQSVSQVSSTYGPGVAQALVENCGNTLVLRSSGSENGGTSQFAARLIGDHELVRRQRTRGRDGGGLFTANGRRSSQVSDQPVIESAVMPAELERLPDLTGYLKAAADPDWYRVRLASPARPAGVLRTDDR